MGSAITSWHEPSLIQVLEQGTLQRDSFKFNRKIGLVIYVIIQISKLPMSIKPGLSTDLKGLISILKSVDLGLGPDRHQITT